MFGSDQVDPEQRENLRLLVAAVRKPESGPAEVTVRDLRAEFRRLRDWPPDSEVTGENLRELVSLTGEARALLPEGERVTRAHLVQTRARTVLARFAGLPQNAVAVNADGTYMTVPSGIGVIASMANPSFFTAQGQDFGRVILPGVRENEEEVIFDAIRKETSVPRITSLILWYLAAHTAAPRLTVNFIAAENLKRILGSLGLTWVDLAEMDMTGDTWTIAQEARAAAERQGWTLRPTG